MALLPVAGREEIPTPPASVIINPTQLADALGHHAGSTAAQVLRFLAEAPVADRERLRLGWPREVRGWEFWYSGARELTAERLVSLLAAEGM